MRRQPDLIVRSLHPANPTHSGIDIRSSFNHRKGGPCDIGAMAPLRVLVVGDVNGEVGKLYKRVASVMKKSGAFDMLLVSGSFFSAEGGADETWMSFTRGDAKGQNSTTALATTSLRCAPSP